MGNMPKIIKAKSKKVKAAPKITQPKADKLVSLGISSVKKFQKDLPQYVKVARSSKVTYIAIAIIILALLVTFKKSWFIAATVNGTPVSNIELQQALNSGFRQQMLDQIINEKIILGEAQKNKVNVTSAEINARLAELEKNVGGAQTLDSLLAQQNQTRTSFMDQLKIQLFIEKLYDKEATVSADEVVKFVEDNIGQLQATESAAQTQEATQLLKQQKVTQIFQQKFQTLKSAANIQIF